MYDSNCRLLLSVKLKGLGSAVPNYISMHTKLVLITKTYRRLVTTVHLLTSPNTQVLSGKEHDMTRRTVPIPRFSVGRSMV